MPLQTFQSKGAKGLVVVLVPNILRAFKRRLWSISVSMTPRQTMAIVLGCRKPGLCAFIFPDNAEHGLSLTCSSSCSNLRFVSLTFHLLPQSILASRYKGKRFTFWPCFPFVM
jgi:hypothetical protein